MNGSVNVHAGDLKEQSVNLLSTQLVNIIDKVSEVLSIYKTLKKIVIVFNALSVVRRGVFCVMVLMLRRQGI